jgi:hypothetical protein
MTNYAIGFVSGLEITVPFFNSVLQAVVRDHCGVVSVLSGPVLHRARNQLAEMFLNGQGGDCDRLLMVDSDIVFTLDDVDAILAHDEPVVSGVYQGPEGVVEQGCGFLLIHRKVLEELKPFPFNPIKLEDGVVSGEDVGFRFHARKAGYEAVIDHSIAVGHIKPQVLQVEALVPA